MTNENNKSPKQQVNLLLGAYKEGDD